MIIKVLTMQYWGKYSEKFGNRNIMIVSGLLIATIPLWWFLSGILFVGSAKIFFFIMFAEAVSGFAWGGFDLTAFNYILETCDKEILARSTAYFNLILGFAVLIGGLLGAFIVKNMDNLNVGIDILLLLMLFSFILRFIVIIFFTKKIGDVSHKRIDETKLMYELVIERPISTVAATTYHTMIFAERHIEKATFSAGNTLKNLARPIAPGAKTLIRTIDKGLDKAELVRKKIEPKLIRTHKKKMYDELTNHEFEEYTRTHPEIAKRIDSKIRRKKD